MLRKLTPYLLVAPLMIFITVFTYIPVITSVNLSFRHWDFLSPTMPFVGFENYRLLLNSRDFWNSLQVTAICADPSTCPAGWNLTVTSPSRSSSP